MLAQMCIEFLSDIQLIVITGVDIEFFLELVLLHSQGYC
jgi:hypothetical protein